MTGKIFRSCFLVGLAVMILCTGLFVAVMASQYEEEVYQQLQEELAYVKHGMEESGQAYLTGLRTTQRLTWVDTDGTVLYDSVADPATMENHGDRAEIRWRRALDRENISPTPCCKRISTMPPVCRTGRFCGFPVWRPRWGR